MSPGTWLVVTLLLPWNAWISSAQAPSTPAAPTQAFAVSTAPLDVSFCALGTDPAAYDHKRIRLTAFITYGFEDFNIVDPKCTLPERLNMFSVWVTYAGSVNSGAIYCCPGEGVQRPKALKIDEVEVPLVDDETFGAFRSLLAKEGDTTVRLTMSGVFLAGRKTENERGVLWSGYGHMGGGSLFVLQQVERFDSHDRKDLDYSADGGWYEQARFERPCRNSGSMSYGPRAAIDTLWDARAHGITWQGRADSGEVPWAFDNPSRVATEAAQAEYGKDLKALRLVKKTPVRQVFQWKAGKRSVVVVVTRPYWMSFFAKTDKVPWTVSMISDSRCD